MSAVVLRPSDGTGSRLPSCMYSLLIEVNGAGAGAARVLAAASNDTFDPALALLEPIASSL